MGKIRQHSLIIQNKNNLLHRSINASITETKDSCSLVCLRWIDGGPLVKVRRKLYQPLGPDHRQVAHVRFARLHDLGEQNPANKTLSIIKYI